MNRWVHLVGVVCIVVFFSASAPTASAADPIAHWRFDEGAGTTAIDSSGNEHDGTISGATYSTSTPSGLNFENPYSLEFDGVNDGVSTPLSVDNLSQFTISGWAYPRTATVDVGWFGANDVVEFLFGVDDELRCWTSAAVVGWQYGHDFLNNWHHITCLGDGDRVTLYVDGEEVASTAHEHVDSYGSGDNFSIGLGVQAGGSSGPFDGFIDDVRVYNVALTPSEMLSLGTGDDEPVDNPTLTSLSPSDNAVGVDVSSTLELTFNKDVMWALVEDSVRVYRADGDVLFFALGGEEGGATTTLAINPSTNFDYETEYYVIIDSGAVVDTEGNPFMGITASSTWSFTTASSTDPLIEVDRVVSITKTTATFQGYFEPGVVAMDEVGFYYDTDELFESPLQVVAEDGVVEGSFTGSVTGLVCEQRYYVKAYTIDVEETLWESDDLVSFTTVECVDPVDEPLGVDDIYRVVRPYMDDNLMFWTSVSVSADGERMVATGISDGGSSGGLVYVSDDGGTSWALPAGFEMVFPISSTISADGMKMIVAGFTIEEGPMLFDTLRTFISVDGGVTWEQGGEVVNENIVMGDDAEFVFYMTLMFSRVRASEDFSKIYVHFYNQFFSSDDEGETWSSQFDFDGAPFIITALDVSGPGEYIYATVAPFFLFGETGDSFLIVSADDGETWDLLYADDAAPFFSIAVSSNGRRMFMTSLTEVMHVSLDAGDTWSLSENPDGYMWMYVAPSDEGNGVFASAYDPSESQLHLYYSPDAGITWERQSHLGVLDFDSPDFISQLIGNISSSRDLSRIGLVNFAQLYVITRGEEVPTPPERTHTRRTSSSPVPCSATRTSFCRAELTPKSAPVQTVASLVAEHRELFIIAHGMGIELPSYILDMLGLSAPVGTVRDLELDMEGEDVRALQTLLMNQGHSIPAGTTGYFGIQTQYALDAYQVAQGIAPRGGYFGPITRTQMKGAGLGGLWW